MSRLIMTNPHGVVVWHREDGPPSVGEKRLREIPHVQNPTVAWARAHGCRATKLQGPGNRSQPDYIFRIPGGRPFLIEFKRPGEVPTPLQARTIGEWLADGYDVEVHDTKETAIAALKNRTVGLKCRAPLSRFDPGDK